MRVCVVGFGFAGRDFHCPLVVACKATKLVAIVSSKSVEEVGKKYDGVAVFATLEEAVARCNFDLVVIATPNASHFSLASLALCYGKHVVIDKPFTVTSDEARALHTLAEERRLVLTCFQNRRWDGDFRTVQREVQGLGEVVLFRSQWLRWRPVIPTTNWRWNANEPASGLLWDLGPHMLDQAFVLFGKPSSVSCVTSKQRKGALTDDYFLLTLRYGVARPRLTVILEAGCMFDSRDGQRTFFVYGDEGSLEKHRGIDTQEDSLKAGVMPRSDATWGVEPASSWAFVKKNGSDAMAVKSEAGDYVLFYENVAAAIAGTQKLEVTSEHAVYMMELLEAAHKSAATGQTITLSTV